MIRGLLLAVDQSETLFNWIPVTTGQRPGVNCCATRLVESKAPYE